MSGATSASNRVVLNQAPLLAGHNVVTSDRALSEAVLRHGSQETLDSLVALGFEAGSEEARTQGMLANVHHPELMSYNRYGERVDEVEFHPSWHWLMERCIGHGLAAAPWESDGPHSFYLTVPAYLMAKQFQIKCVASRIC